MNTILVPIDFSCTAKNAALYALKLAKQVGSKKILLYNAYQTAMNVVPDPMVPALAVLDIETIREASVNGLNDTKKLLEASDADIEIETLSEFNLLTEGVGILCENNEIDLIVMGITGGGELKENFIGSNTISVAKHIHVPVIIVPRNAAFTTIEKVMLVCDFQKVVETTPIGSITKILDETKAKLFVFNVDHNKKTHTPDRPFEALMLDTLFQGYDPQYHFADDPDFTECINEFAEEEKIDLIISIPKKHGIFDSLFKKSHTRMLAFHSHVPLMVIHE
jgi:nucleotide-binding universal stress UspA family protein